MHPTKHSTIKPSEVCDRVTRQHRAVAAQLDEMARGVKALLTGGPDALKRLLELTGTLCDELTKHIVSESKILVPALRDADAWGKQRADKLLDQLRTRRRKLKDLRQSVNDEKAALAGNLDRFIDDRRADMEQTERESVNPRVLRDDVIGIDSHGG